MNDDTFILSEIAADYRSISASAGSGKAAVLMCRIEGREIEVHKLGRHSGGFFSVQSADEEGRDFRIYAHVRRAYFTIRLIDSKQPSRNIGFADIAEQKK